MSGAKRLAKRSIIGTRVSALWQQDGRYYPGSIRALVAEATPATSALYTVRFDDGFESGVNSVDIVGPGFRTVPSKWLKHGQKVFVTLNGREVCGLVAHHDRRTEEVIIIVKQQLQQQQQQTVHGTAMVMEEMTIHRKVDDVRLIESRKSARLQDHATDYSKLADVHHQGDQRRRPVSHSIDVPSKQLCHGRYRNSSGETESSGSCEVDDMEMMDETIAAMVLTSLSVSPASPSLTSRFTFPGVSGSRPGEGQQEQGSVSSSGFYSGQSDRGDPATPPSPPSHLPLHHASIPSPNSVHSLSPLEEEGRLSLHSTQGSGAVHFRCSWRRCHTVFEVRSDVERHIRRVHLDLDSDIELSDNEEDFYYEEISDEDMDSVTQSFAGMLASSPPGSESVPVETLSTFDHDYLKKEATVSTSLPCSGIYHQEETTTSTSLPIAIPEEQIKRSLSWQVHSPSNGVLTSPPQRCNKLTPQERLQQHQAQSPKSHMLHTSPLKSAGPHRKPRSDVRKCRKVYGMDRRDLWCTQCKWKKACTRYLD